MQTRHGQGEVPHGLSCFVETRQATITVQLQRQSGEINPFMAGHRPPGIRLKVLPKNRAVAVGQYSAASISETLQRGDQIVEIAVVVCVVELKVGQHPEMSLKLHQ